MDLPGLLSLGALVLLLPMLSYEAQPNLTRLIMPLSVLAFLTNLHHVRREQVHPSMVCLAALFGYFAVSALLENPGETVGPLYRFAKFTALALALSLVVRQRRQLLAVLCAVAVSAIYVAIASRGALTETHQAISQALMSDRPADLARTAGVFGNSNDLAMFAVDAIVAAVTLFLSVRKATVLVVAVPAAAAAARLALFSGSRKALIGMFLVVVFVFWHLFRTRKAATLPVLLMSLAMGIGGVAWILNNPYLSRFDTQESSFKIREWLLTEAVEVWQQHPVLGLGYHGFLRVSRTGFYTHCTPFEMLTNGGIVAFGLYAFLWWGLFRTAARCLAGEKDQKHVTLLYGVGCFLVVSASNSLTSVTLEDPRWLVLTGCICGFLRAKELELREAAKPARKIWSTRGITGGAPPGARGRFRHYYRPHLTLPRPRSASPVGTGLKPFLPPLRRRLRRAVATALRAKGGPQKSP